MSGSSQLHMYVTGQCELALETASNFCVHESTDPEGVDTSRGTDDYLGPFWSFGLAHWVASHILILTG